MNEILENLEKKKCTILKKENYSAIVKCSNSYLIKSPYDQWQLYVAATKLNSLKKKLKNEIHPQLIETGKFISTGNWSKTFKFNIDNEIQYIFNKKTIEEINDTEIKKYISIMKDQESLFDEHITEFNLEKEYKKNLSKITNKINDLLYNNLKKTFSNPITCYSKPETQKYWTSYGEKIIYRIKSVCVIPKIKNEIEELVHSTLINSTISQSDVRFINSYITKDNNLMLSGIKIHQHDIPYPLLKFTLKNENIIFNSNFYDTIKSLEKAFSNENNENLKELKLETLTNFLF